jgi:predicted helicase
MGFCLPLRPGQWVTVVGENHGMIVLSGTNPIHALFKNQWNKNIDWRISWSEGKQSIKRRTFELLRKNTLHLHMYRPSLERHLMYVKNINVLNQTYEDLIHMGLR